MFDFERFMEIINICMPFVVVYLLFNFLVFIIKKRLNADEKDIFDKIHRIIVRENLDKSSD